MNTRKTRLTPAQLRKAVEFHGHLGPWLVIGLLMGLVALKELKAKKHFGIKVKVRGAGKRPRSCLIDGLQLSTGATYGKGNILASADSSSLYVSFINTADTRSITFRLKEPLFRKLKSLNTHSESEEFARLLAGSNPAAMFIMRARP